VTSLHETDGSKSFDPQYESPSPVGRIALDESSFRRMIALERKRTERSRAPFVLALLEVAEPSSTTRSAYDSILSCLLASSRDTDVVGWYRDKTAVGAMYTGLPMSDKNSLLTTILSRITTTLHDGLTPDRFSQVSISLHFFPDDWNHDHPGRPSNPALYPDLQSEDRDKRPLLLLKRVVDVIGSALVMLLMAPIFFGIAMAVKVSSKGPVFYRQQRVGRHGKHFTFLKFRSMYSNNDHNVHREYVTRLIAGEAERVTSDRKGEGIYKLAGDKRITPLGKFLRRTSLDELPQLINVLCGEMSLVGPRPPIPYELAAYQTWHRRRLLEVKPGITGLWQVTGRSTVGFDEMVRLDLRYATTWSPWLDLEILLRTPAAVIKGSGAC
jgi:lipopolysaccharide/colanic/teichoic acid biosynthesis glycosyltransferase